MENAVKALLIAAGVLIGLILISLLLVGHREISDYYTAKEEAKEFAQLDEFNKQYIPYDRDNVRGSDLLSLVNKIIDFNTLSEEEDIEIKILIPGTSWNGGRSKLFYYNYDTYNGSDQRLIELNTNGDLTFTQDNINPIVQSANRIEDTYKGQSVAKSLAENLYTLMEGEDEDREQLFKRLKLNLNPSDSTECQNDILKYYQYMQFKRAHFDSLGLTYTNQGRVKSFEFKFNGKFE